VLLDDGMHCREPLEIDGERFDVVAVHAGYVPLQHTCEFANGTVDRLVPVAANVVMYGGFVGAVVSFVVAWVLSRRLDRTLPPSGPLAR
jgi:hypothetical protein